jgi:type IV pilus assembly protein PilB
MNDPTNFYAIDDVRMVTGADVAVVIAEKQEILNAINNYYGVSGRVGDAMGKLAEETAAQSRNVTTMIDSYRTTTRRSLRLSILLSSRASGTKPAIFISNRWLRRPGSATVLTACCIRRPAFPLASHNALVSRVKIMSNLDIAEKRVPQDGRIKLAITAAEIDLRISTLPTILGEKIVMRILDKGAAMIKLSSLGFSETI